MIATRSGALRRAGSPLLAGAIGVVLAAGVVVATTASPSTAAGKPTAPAPITLVFAGQVTGDEGLSDFTDPYPPVEGGPAQKYTVPSGQRLVIESLYAQVVEQWVPGQTPRRDVQVGVSSWYPLPEPCQFPGYQRDYGIPLVAPLVQDSDNESQARSHGSLPGPIFVEGGRALTGTAFAPHGDSVLIVTITAHGYLEAATNPAPPTFDCAE